MIVAISCFEFCVECLRFNFFSAFVLLFPMETKESICNCYNCLAEAVCYLTVGANPTSRVSSPNLLRKKEWSNCCMEFRIVIEKYG